MRSLPTSAALPLLCTATCCAVLAAPAVSAPPAGAAGNVPDTFNLRITAELRALSPAAESLWVEANQLREHGRQRAAADLYRRVIILAPDFYHAKRRLAMILLADGQRPSALVLMREAHGAAETPENLTALAAAIIRTDLPIAEAEVQEALALATRAVGLKPDDPFTLATLCMTALTADDPDRLRAAAEHLATVAPDSLEAHLFLAFSRSIDGRHDEADAELERAHALGLDDANYESYRTALAKARSHLTPGGLLRIGEWVLGTWLAALLLLLGAGLFLSWATLRRVRELPATTAGSPTGIEALIRHIYRGVLWLSCLYYYSSMPILFVVVLAAGAGLIYLSFVLGRVPIKLVLVIAVITLVTAWSLLKSLVVRGRDVDPGERLDLAKHPALAAVLREVAAKVGTRPVDNVYMTPGTDIAVMERGGMARQLRGDPERCLILGAGVLEGLPLGEFKSILAHEYGHFSNRDTAGGGFALAVRRSMQAMAQNLIAGDVARWYNPAWLFVLGFNRVFLRISQGASRLQEVLADRWAALAYGSGSFVKGLRHVIENSVRFDLRSGATLKEVVEHKGTLPNLYRQAPGNGGPDQEEVARAIAAALDAEPSPYDSHPSPADRMEWVGALGAPGSDTGAGDVDVWSLFGDREEIEQHMTAQVRENVHQIYGVRIAAERPAQEEPAPREVAP